MADKATITLEVAPEASQPVKVVKAAQPAPEANKAPPAAKASKAPTNDDKPTPEKENKPGAKPGAKPPRRRSASKDDTKTVSYTHLTLPTICSV